MKSSPFGSISFLLFIASAASAACSEDDTPLDAPDDSGGRGGSPGAHAGSGALAGRTQAGSGGAGSGGAGNGGKPASGGSGGAGSAGKAHGAGGKAQGAAGRGAGGGTAGSSAPGGRSGAAGEAGGDNDGGEAGSAGSGDSGAFGAGSHGGEGGGSGGAGGRSDGEAGRDSGGVAGEAGAAHDERREFVYVSRLIGGVEALAIDPDTGALAELEGSPVDTGRFLYAVAAEPERRFLFTAEPNEGHIDSYRIAADGSLPTSPSSSHVIDAQPIVLAVGRSGDVLYAGTLEDQSIHVLGIDPETGDLDAAADPLLLPTPPAYLATEPSGRFLYETQEFEPGIRAFRIGARGALTELEGSPFGGTLVRSGALVSTPDGAFLFSSGQALNAFAIDPRSGSLRLVDGSPFSNDVSSDFFAGNLAVDPRGEFLYVTSFSTTQHVSGFAILPNGALEAVPDSPRSTPWPYSVAVEPSGRFLYVGSDNGDTAVFTIDRTNGSLHELETSPFPFGGFQPEFAFVGGR